MDRRNFLKHSLVGASVAAGLPGLNRSLLAAESPKAVLKLCSQAHLVPGGSIKEKAEKIVRWGGCGLEFGAMDLAQAEKTRKELDGTGVGAAAICYGAQKGALASLDPAVRQKGMDNLKKMLEAAAILGSNGVIWVMCFNKETTLTPPELDKILEVILPELAEHAVKVKSRILIEPLTKRETFYINRLEQAAYWCNKVNSPGLCMMGDFYHMSLEESDQEKAFVTGGKWVHHVHLATGKSRILPSQEPHSYVEGFKGLKRIGYQDYCSLECGIKPTKQVEGQAKLQRDPDVEIPKAFAFLKQQWEAAKVGA